MSCCQTRPRRGAILIATIASISSPAFADHMGATSFSPGGGLNVFTPDTLDADHWSAGFRLAYMRPERRSDGELQALAAQHVHAHNTDYNLNASIGVAYGINHHVTLSAELPYVRRDHLREGTHAHVGGIAINGVEQLGNVDGFGDMNLLVKYRLGEGSTSGFALIGGVKIPTGSTRKRTLDGERLETEHQPGPGSWDPIIGTSASADLGQVQLTASALYQLSTKGAQHTRLGNRLQGGVALSHRFGQNRPDHAQGRNRHHGDELDEHIDATSRSSWDAFFELAGEWEGRQIVDGEVEPASGGKWVYVAPGVRFNAASGWSAGVSLALPVWQRVRASHPNNRYRLTLAIGRAF